ncbi:MAG: hypothetical protein SFU83_23255 [Meiothermus sp.]|nr:hypothetical protein [Meiothermus sp.]
MISGADLELLRQAEQVAAVLEGERHTVAAAVRDHRGRVYTGVNLYHFTGGPCAEPVALAVAAANNAGTLELIVAVGNRGRGVLAPCGRCRQILFDYFPDIEVLVQGNGEVRRVGIRELLPYTYDWGAQQH